MNKCKGCQWHNKPYWSIINPCDSCPRESTNIEIFTRWVDPTIEEYKKEIDRLNNIINECMESVCCIEHKLEKYEEIGLDHFDYALNKTIELKEYLYEELKEGNK